MKKNIFMVILLIVAAAMPLYAKKDKDAYEALKPLMEVYAIVQDTYVDEEKTQPGDLVSGAIKGMVQTLDPFSQYLDQQSFKDMNEDTKAEFGGLGIEISIKDGQLTVVAPIEDTPASNAGIQAGDKIVFIDGETTDGLEVMDAVHKLRGTPGTKVTITVQRGQEQPKDYVITRAIIKIETARYSVINGKYGYIRINEFMGKASDVVLKAIGEFREKKVKKVIIDLRNNPGGLLDQAIKVSDIFLPNDKVIVSTAGRNKDKIQKFKSSDNIEFKGDIVIIVNEGSASASEILAAALKDNEKAVIIGTNTFGKGSVQTIIPLSDNSAIRLTTQQYFSPNGTKIHGVGVKPDIEIKDPVASTFSVELMEKGYITEFVTEYLKKNPDGLDNSKKEKNGANVSESDIKVFFKKSFDEKLMEDFGKWLKQKGEEVQAQEFVADSEILAKWIKTEMALKQKGRSASRAVAVENDTQIKRAMDILDTVARLSHN
jgi:carboxyl-terminal processing protease